MAKIGVIFLKCTEQENGTVPMHQYTYNDKPADSYETPFEGIWECHEPNVNITGLFR